MSLYSVLTILVRVIKLKLKYSNTRYSKVSLKFVFYEYINFHNASYIATSTFRFYKITKTLATFCTAHETVNFLYTRNTVYCARNVHIYEYVA